MLAFSPSVTLEEVTNSLVAKASAILDAGGKLLCINFVILTDSLGFLVGGSLAEVKNTTSWILDGSVARGPFKIPETIKFIGSLGEYVKSLPQVEEDWWKGTF